MRVTIPLSSISSLAIHLMERRQYALPADVARDYGPRLERDYDQKQREKILKIALKHGRKEAATTGHALALALAQYHPGFCQDPDRFLAMVRNKLLELEPKCLSFPIRYGPRRPQQPIAAPLLGLGLDEFVPSASCALLGLPPSESEYQRMIDYEERQLKHMADPSVRWQYRHWLETFRKFFAPNTRAVLMRRLLLGALFGDPPSCTPVTALALLTELVDRGFLLLTWSLSEGRAAIRHLLEAIDATDFFQDAAPPPRPGEVVVIDLVKEDEAEEAPKKPRGEPDEDEDNLCGICESAAIDTVFVECGHMYACVGCATRLYTTRRECPLCRTALKRPPLKVFRKGSV